MTTLETVTLRQAQGITLADLLNWSVQVAEAVAEDTDELDEGDFMNMTLDNLRSGRLTNNCQMMDAELEIMHSEIIGLEFSTRPFQF